MASLMEELYEAVKTLNPQVLVTSKDQVELRDAMASLMEDLNKITSFWRLFLHFCKYYSSYFHLFYTV